MALGEGVENFRIGQRVAGYCSYGAARSRLVLPAPSLSPVPDELDDDQAAGLFVTYGTTLHALRQRADLQNGETLAVLGASGGVGLAAVEIGAAMGAHVIACASSRGKTSLRGKVGAHEGLDYSVEDLKEGLKKRAGGKGVDCVYDAIGGAYSEAALRAMAWKGRFLVVGFASGEIPKIPLNLTLAQGLRRYRRLLGRIRQARAARPIATTWRRSSTGPREKSFPPMSTPSIRSPRSLRRCDVLKDRNAQGKILLSIPQ